MPRQKNKKVDSGKVYEAAPLSDTQETKTGNMLTVDQIRYGSDELIWNFKPGAGQRYAEAMFAAFVTSKNTQSPVVGQLTSQPIREIA